MAIAYFVKTIENQTVQVSDGSPSPNPVPLTLGQNYLNCVPFTTFDAQNKNVWARTIPYVHMVSNSGGSVDWERGNIFGTNQASCYIVEFDSTYIKVQHTYFETSYADSNSGITTGSVTIDEVDLSRTFLVPNHQGAEVGEIFRDLNTQCFFDSSTKIRTVRNTNVGTTRAYLVVVEALDSYIWNVAHLDFTITPGNSETLVNVPQDAEWTRQSSNTFIIATFMSDENSNNPDEGFITADWSGGQIRVRKGSTAATITGKIQLVTSPSFEVQRGQIDFGIGVTNKTASINAITTANSMVWNTAPYGSRTLGDTEDNEGMARIKIQDSTTIAGQKNSSGIAHATDGAFQVIEFSGDDPLEHIVTSSQAYTIYKEYIDEELSWFPVTVPMTTTQAPTGFWEYFDTKLVNDNFTGTNGSAPDSERWSNSGTSIQGNKLRLNSTSNVQVDSVFTLQGDFEIEHDFSLNLHPETDRWAYQMRLTDVTSGSSDLFSVMREYRTGAPFVGNQYVCYKSNGGTEDPVNGIVINRDDLTGRLRVRRVGTTMYGDYFHPSNGWTNITSESMTGLTGDCQVGLWLRRWNANPTAEMDIDYIKIWADSIDWTEGEQYLSADDDFTGVDGAVPNTDLWSPGGAYPPTIQSNKINFDIGAGGSIQRGWAQSKFSITGDFDVVVDFDIASGPSTNSWRAQLQVKIDNDNYCQIARAYTGAYGASYFAEGEENNVYDTSWASTSDSSGKLRITRKGSSTTCHYWDGSKWIILHDFNIGTGELEYVELTCYNWISFPAHEINFDNFQINGADKIIWNHFADKLFFEDIDSNKLYTEIETFNTSTSAATFHTAVPTVSAGDDTPLTLNWDWEGREYSTRPIFNANDDFTGSDGDPPDEMKWTETDPDNVMSIQSNKLHFDGGGSGNKISMVLTRYGLGGDFDVQVDFDLITWTEPATAPNYVRFQLIESGNTGKYVYIARQYTEPSNGNRIRAVGSDGTNGLWAWTGTSGKFRFTRSGSTIKLYLWTGSQWEWDGNTAGLTCSETFTGLAKVLMLFEQETGGDVEATLDNFQINSADSITGWTEDTGEFASQQVWDDNFKIVTHLADTPTGSADDILDSTSNEYHGTSYNMDSTNSGSNEYGKYLTFDGSSEWIGFGDAFYSDILTLECLINPTVVNDYDALLHKRNIVGTVNKIDPSQWELSIQPTGNIRAVAWQDAANIVQVDSSTADLVAGVENYVAGAFPGNGSGNAVVQVDDSEIGSATHNRTIGDRASGIQVAARTNNTDTRYYNGDIREIRISSSFRSEAWRIATYYSLFGTLFDVPPPTEWDLVIQDMTVATSAEQISLFAQLIIQNLNILTSTEVTKLIPLLNINDLNINTVVGRMKFWEALSTINTSVEFRTLLRTLISRTPKHSIESKTLKRTLRKYGG